VFAFLATLRQKHKHNMADSSSPRLVTEELKGITYTIHKPAFTIKVQKEIDEDRVPVRTNERHNEMIEQYNALNKKKWAKDHQRVRRAWMAVLLVVVVCSAVLTFVLIKYLPKHNKPTSQ
jgi:hypothetical protein